VHRGQVDLVGRVLLLGVVFTPDAALTVWFAMSFQKDTTFGPSTDRDAALLRARSPTGDEAHETVATRAPDRAIDHNVSSKLSPSSAGANMDQCPA